MLTNINIISTLIIFRTSHFEIDTSRNCCIITPNIHNTKQTFNEHKINQLIFLTHQTRTDPLVPTPQHNHPKTTPDRRHRHRTRIKPEDLRRRITCKLRFIRFKHRIIKSKPERAISMHPGQTTLSFNLNSQYGNAERCLSNIIVYVHFSLTRPESGACSPSRGGSPLFYFIYLFSRRLFAGDCSWGGGFGAAFYCRAFASKIRWSRLRFSFVC